MTGLPLPPSRLRAGGHHFTADPDFLATARAEAARLVELARLERGGQVLDVGCGAGRLAYGLAAHRPEAIQYLGVDIRPEAIAWARSEITSKFPWLRFRLLDVKNERYNQAGVTPAVRARLPVRSGSQIAVYAYSLFSHMPSTEVAAYLKEFRRVLRRDGIVVVTAFVEDDVIDEAVNPPGYGPITWDGPLHCVRFSRQRFSTLVSAARFHIQETHQGTETDGQSLFVIKPS